MSIIRTYNFFINSKYRSSGTTTDFNLRIPNPIVLSNPSNHFTAKVVSAEIPFSFKSINNSNNQLDVKLIHSGITYNGTITIPKGNYNALSLLTELETQLNAFFLLHHSPINYTFTFTYDRNTGKNTFLIAKDSGGSTSWTLYWTSNLVLSTFFGFDGSKIGRAHV
jgi:hypothetical protein